MIIKTYYKQDTKENTTNTNKTKSKEQIFNKQIVNYNDLYQFDDETLKKIRSDKP